MLTIKAGLRRQRAVLAGGVAEARTDDQLRIYKLVYDERNRRALVHLEEGHMVDGVWNPSDVIRRAVIDDTFGHQNPLHDDVWGYLQQRIAARGDLSFNLLERVIRKRELLLDEIEETAPAGEA